MAGKNNPLPPSSNRREEVGVRLHEEHRSRIIHKVSTDIQARLWQRASPPMFSSPQVQEVQEPGSVEGVQSVLIPECIFSPIGLWYSCRNAALVFDLHAALVNDLSGAYPQPVSFLHLLPCNDAFCINTPGYYSACLYVYIGQQASGCGSQNAYRYLEHSLNFQTLGEDCVLTLFNQYCVLSCMHAESLLKQTILDVAADLCMYFLLTLLLYTSISLSPRSKC